MLVRNNSACAHLTHNDEIQNRNSIRAALNIFLKAIVPIEETGWRPYITILIYGKNMRDMEALATILSDGDEVAIFPPD